MIAEQLAAILTAWSALTGACLAVGFWPVKS
jgi:hypothetical protein